MNSKVKASILVCFALLAVPVVFGQVGGSSPGQGTTDNSNRYQQESILFDKLGNRVADVVYRLRFRMEDALPVFESAEYLGTRYTLVDGTQIIRSRESKTDIYVTDIFEHRNARKTVVILPAVYTDVEWGFEKFLVLQDVVSGNPGKTIYILLEGIESGSPVIDEFSALRTADLYLDINKTVSEPLALFAGLGKTRTAVSPSMALFYQKDGIRLDGLLDAVEPLEPAEGVEPDVQTDAEEIAVRWFDELSRDYVAGQVHRLVIDLEGEITRAAGLPGNRGNTVVNRLNEYQRNLAETLTSSEYLQGEIREGVDTNIRLILGDIDALIGSATDEVYDRFTDRISHARSVALNIAELTEKDEPVTVGNSPSAYRDRALAIAAAFERLPDGSIAVCELSADMVDEQILLALRSADYNVILYNEPYAEPHLNTVRYVQSPDEHRTVLEKSAMDLDLDTLYVPRAYVGRLDETALDTIGKQLKVFRSAYRDADDEKGTLVHYFQATDAGGLLRITDLESQNDEYYFLPGADLEEQSKQAPQAYAREEIPELSRLLIRKWAQVTQASLGL